MDYLHVDLVGQLVQEIQGNQLGPEIKGDTPSQLSGLVPLILCWLFLDQCGSTTDPNQKHLLVLPVFLCHPLAQQLLKDPTRTNQSSEFAAT